jgi:DNA polymerase-3 subunit delta
MLHKSFLIEENTSLLKNNAALFYGENTGLINDFKKKITDENKLINILKFVQDDILKNRNILYEEINNISLFEEKKIIFIDNASDKIFDVVQNVLQKIDKNKIYLFSGILEKKSKLRSFFEKSQDCDIIPCYQDNEISIKKLIQKKLKNCSGITTQVINTIIANTGLDRVKLQNELDKIVIFFNDEDLDNEKLNKLLNIKINDDFNEIKDAALKGNNHSTNILLNSTIFEIDKIPLYLNIINQRLNKLKVISKLSEQSNLSVAIEKIKPAIFWKDKPHFLEQAKLWNSSKTEKALNKTYQLEMILKSNADINKSILIRKLMLDICVLANT